MTTVTVLRGLPGSGKTTWVRELASRLPIGAVTRINNDDLVQGMFPECENIRLDGVGELLANIRKDMLKRLIASGVSEIIVDNTNLRVTTVRELEHITAECGANFVVLDDFLDMPVEECIRRDSRREHPVGKNVIRKMALDACKLTPWVYTANKFTPVVIDSALPSCVVFDIDGTLAHKHPDRDVYDGSLAHLDSPDAHVTSYAKRLIADGDTEVVIMSGRSEKHRDITEAWIEKHVGVGLSVFMRPAGDRRRDSIVKRELLEREILPRWNLIHAIDDRNQVVNMWRQSGIPVWQVADGDF
jgi:predicted kinase